MPHDVNEITALDAESAEVAARTLRNAQIHLAVVALGLLALVAALYLARGFFVPLLIGILASYALHPLVDKLEVVRIPRGIGSALVLSMVVGAFSWVSVAMSVDAAALIEKLPEAARNLRRDLSTARAGPPTALQNMQEAAQELQGAAADASTPAGTAIKSATAGNAPVQERAPVRGNAPIRAAAPAEPTWLKDYTIAQSALLASVAAQTPIVLLLTYFLLASGVHFRRKLVHLVGPSLSRKKEVVRILEEIDVQVQRYLLSTLLTNALLGLATWLVFLALGLEEAGVWGIAAGVFHFVPYLGPALIAFGSGVAAFLQFDSLGYAFLVAGLSLVVSAIIGFAFMTWLQSRFARVNAAVLFIALLFFGWLWGIWGLLLGAPLVAIAKVIFDRVESLKPVGELMGQ